MKRCRHRGKYHLADDMHITAPLVKNQQEFFFISRVVLETMEDAVLLKYWSERGKRERERERGARERGNEQASE